VIVQFLPYRHTISGILKHEKMGFTSHSSEPHPILRFDKSSKSILFSAAKSH